MALTRVVLPTPGPPVMTKARLVRASLSASLWLGGKLLAGLVLAPDYRLLEINRREGGRRAGEAPDPGGDDFLGPLQSAAGRPVPAR